MNQRRRKESGKEAADFGRQNIHFLRKNWTWWPSSNRCLTLPCTTIRFCVLYGLRLSRKQADYKRRMHLMGSWHLDKRLMIVFFYMVKDSLSEEIFQQLLFDPHPGQFFRVNVTKLFFSVHVDLEWLRKDVSQRQKQVFSEWTSKTDQSMGVRGEMLLLSALIKK